MERRNNGGNDTFDWGGLRQQLADTLQELESSADAQATGKFQEILAQRARQLAQVPASEDQGQHLELVLIRLGRELYGLEARYIFRIRPATQITRVPRVPAWIMGVANIRGRVLSVFDLRAYLGLADGEKNGAGPTQPYLVVIETPEMELALLADEVLDVVSLPITRIQAVDEVVRGIPQDYVRGIVNELEIQGHGNGRDDHRHLLIVLDLRALLADERLVVHEEVA